MRIRDQQGNVVEIETEEEAKARTGDVQFGCSWFDERGMPRPAVKTADDEELGGLTCK